MERRVTVEFGPSRSKRFAKAVAEAQGGPGECRVLEPDRYRVSFVLGEDARVRGSRPSSGASWTSWIRDSRKTGRCPASPRRFGRA